MTRARMLMLIVFIVALASASAMRARESRQEMPMTLLARSYTDRFAPAPTSREQGWERDFEMEVDSARVPLRVRWTTIIDTAQCPRVAKVRVERLGGAASVRFDQVGMTFLPCYLEDRRWVAERANVNLMMWVRRNGVETGGGGSVLTVTGDGRASR